MMFVIKYLMTSHEHPGVSAWTAGVRRDIIGWQLALNIFDAKQTMKFT